MSKKRNKARRRKQLESKRRGKLKKTTPKVDRRPAVVMGDGETTFVPDVNPSRLYQLFLQGKMEQVYDNIIKVLSHYEQNNYTSLNKEAIDKTNNFVSVMLALLTNPEFTLPDSLNGMRILSKSHVFANLVRISTYGSTDAALAHVMGQPVNFLKILFLYTSLNKVKVPVPPLFEAHPKYASLWYFTYILPSIGQVQKHVYDNLIEHIASMDERYTLFDHRLTPLYFACTYLNDGPGGDSRVKEILNKVAQRLTKHVEIKNEPKRDSIAIITAKWFDNSAVHKSCAPLIERLRKNYRLTLVHVGKHIPKTLITEPFDEVRYISFGNDGTLPVEKLDNNDFQLAYFPDVGMNDESVWLSNLRIAPIQVTSYGHPVSTYGSKVDYFVVGSESEDLLALEDNYSERTVVIPGIGAHPTWPNYKAKLPAKESDKVIINCVWGPDKYNYPMMQRMQEIVKRSKREVEFHIFSSQGVHRYQGYMPFLVELKQLLGDSVVLHADKEYYEYMEAAEQADFAINSYPFGGYNTVVEALYLRKPVVTLEGNKFYNKCASCLLEKVGLDKLITHEWEDFVTTVVKLIDSPRLLKQYQDHLRSMDIKAALFDTDEPALFEEAIEYLIDNDAELRAENSRKPIMIGVE
jgi:predicted O-linked N-acetylglucosamine transferase (SPINDLY family)